MKKDVEAEIRKKINILKSRIEKRHTEPSTLQNDQQASIKILENIDNIDFNLTKKTSTLTLMKQIRQSTSNFERQKKNMIESQRKKIHQFNNELLLLNKFISTKNKARAAKAKVQDEGNMEILKKKFHFKLEEVKNQLNHKAQMNEENLNQTKYNRCSYFTFKKNDKNKNRKKSNSRSQHKIKFPEISPVDHLKCQNKQESRISNSKMNNQSKMKMLRQTIDKIYFRNKNMFENSNEQKKLFQSRIQKILKVQEQDQLWNKSNFI